MPSDLSVYDDAFYDAYGHEAAKMAEWFMPLLGQVIPFRSIIDVGCGEGHYVKWCRDNGIAADGIEGSQAAIMRSVGPMIKWDLRIPWRGEVKSSLCLSLEVAEHIDPEFAGVFADTLCGLSDVVVMTAAPPGQGGLEHVNEQPKSYWKILFWDRGFHPDHEAHRKLLEGIFKAQDRGEYVTPWLAPNLMVFKRV